MKWLRLIGVFLLVLTLFHVYEVKGPIYDSWTVTPYTWTYYENGFNWTSEEVEPTPPQGPPPPIPFPDVYEPDPVTGNPYGDILLMSGINFRTNYTDLGSDYLTEYSVHEDLRVSNFSFTGNGLHLTRPTNLFYMNVTGGSVDVNFGLVYWFQNLGGTTETRFTANNTVNLDVYVGSLGEPTQVYGTVSNSFNNVTNICSLVTGTGGDIRLLWQFDPIGEYFFLGLGLGGFVFVGVGCFYSTRRLRNINTDDDILQVSWGLLVALVGVGLIIVWLWP